MNAKNRAGEHILGSRAFPLLSIFSVAAPTFCALAFACLRFLGSSHAAAVAWVWFFVTFGSCAVALIGLVCGERPRALSIAALLFNLALLSLGMFMLGSVLEVD